MHVTFDSKARGCLMRIAALGTGALLLAGCATGYSFVQPDVTGSGSYYTGDGPYAGQYYGGAYGGGLYADPFGWYGPYYGSSISFSIGFGGGWGWPYYSGFYGGAFGGWPWYAGYGYPIYGYGGYGWHRYHHRHTRTDGHHLHGWRDPVAKGTPHRPWRGPDHPRIPRRDDSERVAAPAAPMADFAERRRLPSADFAPRGPARVRIPRPADAGFAEARARPVYVTPTPREPAFAPQSIGGMRGMSSMQSMPHNAGAMPQPAFRAAPMHSPAPAAPAAPAARSGNAPAPRIR